ncbi:vesicle coat component [Myotisia sp. PD_48]|nr:vesicle coat component [Myotisia sp. PD_48]
MAQDSRFGHEGGLLFDTATAVSWNPAHRPENGPIVPITAPSPSPSHSLSEARDLSTSNYTSQVPSRVSGNDDNSWSSSSEPVATPRSTTTFNLPPDPQNNPQETATVAPTDRTGNQGSYQSDASNVGSQLNIYSTPSAVDPFTRHDIVSRTSSFPAFEPENTSPIDDHAHLTQQETEYSTAAPDDQAIFNSWNDSPDNHEDDYEFFNQVNTQTKPIYVPPEASESRYEEGLPLVDDTNAATGNSTAQATIDTIFEDDTNGEDADFFKPKADNVETERVAEHPGLNRKDTSQVMNSLQINGSFQELDSPIEPPSIPSQQVAETAQSETTPNPLAEDELAARWQAALGDDDLLDDELLDDDFLGDDLLDTPATQRIAPEPEHIPMQPPISAHPSFNPYAPHQPSSTSMMQGIAPTVYEQTAEALRAADMRKVSDPTNTQSFVNQSKLGYKSPYDLPDDLQPKRTHRIASQPVSGINPPPRSSSMTGSRPSSSYSAMAPPPVSNFQSPPSVAGATGNQLTGRPTNFFEELPATSRSRPPTRDRYAPQPTAPTYPPAPNAMPTPPTQLTAPTYTPAPNSIPTPPSQPTVEPHIQYQLQAPERMDPYSNVAPIPSAGGSKIASRYSPKPQSLQPKPPAINRYSPAPDSSRAAQQYTGQPPPAHSILPFQPRTSSPLAAHHESANPVPQVQHTPVNSYAPPPVQLTPPGAAHSTFSPNQGSPALYQSNIGNSPANLIHQSPTRQIKPPRRSQTQSPGKRMHSQTHYTIPEEHLPRPASVHGSHSATHLAPSGGPASKTNQTMEYILPEDGQQYDPLERWKGAPIIKFAFGGTMLTTFPKYVPRYFAGQLTPRMKPTVGEVKICAANGALPASDSTVKFPGPLRSKSKKKDVLTWLSQNISAFEAEQQYCSTQTVPYDHQQLEEKILLWKVIRVLVDHDGALHGVLEAEKSVREVFCPPSGLGEPIPLSATPSFPQTASKTAPNGMCLQDIRRNLLLGEREKAVWGAVDNNLWGHAMLLSSTLSQTVWKQVVKEFIQREVRSVDQNSEPLAALYEVFAGNFEESVDELVPPSARAGMQMVSMQAGPTTATNGLDGLNKWQEALSLILNNRSPNDHQAILALGRLLASYGRTEAAHTCFLLAKTGTDAIFGGVDDPQATITLLGADHKRYPFTFMADRHSILLTEVYEFATSVLSTSPSGALPYLQPFKLQHALDLAEAGLKSEAQQYCEAIGSLLKSITKMSPYYNAKFFSQLDELSNRLRLSPTDGSSSWISKPSMENISGSMWAKFSSFVAGDDSDAGSTESHRPHEADQGPFANVVGTPPISQSPADPYGSYFAAAQQPVSVPSSASRYAPGNQYAPYSSPDQNRGRRSLDSQRSSSHSGATRSYPQRRHSQDPSGQTDASYFPTVSTNSYSPGNIGSNLAPQPQYSSLAPVEEASSSQAASIAGELTPASNAPVNDVNNHALPGTTNGQLDSIGSPYGGGYQSPSANTGYEPLTSNTGFTAPLGITGYEPPSGTTGYEPPSGSSGYEPPSGNTGYEPPSGDTGYEPPSYEPVSLSSSAESEDEKPKRKPMMVDDDEDFGVSTASGAPETDRERKAKEAAEIVRKAAEEDAQRAAQAQKKGWFTGWFGKKDQAASGGPIRAKLGEQSSFYYDEELKRWVNKKDPDSATSGAQATPPPPKSSLPPSRSVSSENRPPPSTGSTTSAPPSMLSGHPGAPPRGFSTPAMDNLQPSSRPQSSALNVPFANSPHLAPRSVSAGSPSAQSSRPGTALSNASSIDDLLGAPQGRKAGTVKARKKNRGYVDVMAK